MYNVGGLALWASKLRRHADFMRHMLDAAAQKALRKENPASPCFEDSAAGSGTLVVGGLSGGRLLQSVFVFPVLTFFCKRRWDFPFEAEKCAVGVSQGGGLLGTMGVLAAL